MGFCMTCSKTGKNCGYSTWYEQRTEIIKVVVKYLESKIPEVQEELEEKRDRDDEEDCMYINGFPTIDYDYYLETINKKFLDPIKKARNDDAIFKIVENPEMYHMKDKLTCFGV